jgi:hypothetical protein
MKPELPVEIAEKFPPELVRLIYEFVPHFQKIPKKETSPALEKDLRRIQYLKLNGKNQMYLRDLDDFILN